MLLVVLPLPYVFAPIATLVDSKLMSFAIEPLTLVEVTIRGPKLTLASGLVHVPLAGILVSIIKDFGAVPMFQAL